MFDDKYTFGDMYVKSYTLEFGPNHYASATKGVRTAKNWVDYGKLVSCNRKKNNAILNQRQVSFIIS